MKTRAVAAAALLAGLAGCERKADSDAPALAHENTNTNQLAAAAPIDHLATGELLEGPERAFGLALPRGVRIDSAFADTVYASGPVLLRPLDQYLRARLQGGGLREGESGATFEHVTVAAQPDRELRIHVTNTSLEVHIEMQDTTPAPSPNLPDEKSRWRQVGLTPDGRLADPTHLD